MKVNLKQLSKKTISCILALAVLLCSVTVMFSAFAETEPETVNPYTVSYRSPAIPMFVGKQVALSDLQVDFSEADGDTVSGDEIDWAVDSGDSAMKMGKVFYATKAGITKLTATYGEATQTVYIIVNEVGDTNFYLENLDLTNSANFDATKWVNGIGTNGNGVAINNSNVKYTSTAISVVDGSGMKVPNSQWNYNRAAIMYKSDILKDFADYTVKAGMKLWGVNGDCAPVVQVGIIARATLNDAELVSGTTPILKPGTASLRLGAYGVGGMLIYGINDNENGLPFVPWNYYYSLYTEPEGTNLIYDTTNSKYNPQYVFGTSTGTARTLTYKLDGNDVIYWLDNEKIFDSTRDDSETIGNITHDNGTTLATNPGTVSTDTITQAKFDSQMTTLNAGKGTVGVAVSRCSIYLQTLQVLLNVDEMPNLTDPTFYVVEEGSPAIPMFAGKFVDFDDIALEIDGVLVPASDKKITWAFAEGDAMLINGGIFAPKTGITKLTATYNGGEPKNIYVIANTVDDYNFYLENLNLASTGEGGYVAEDWLGAQLARNPTSANPSIPSTNPIAKSANGIYINAWQTNIMVYNSDILKDFADYTYEAVFSNNWAASTDQLATNAVTLYTRVKTNTTAGEKLFAGNALGIQFGLYGGAAIFNPCTTQAAPATTWGQQQLSSISVADNLHYNGNAPYALINNLGNTYSVKVDGDDLVVKVNGTVVLDTDAETIYTATYTGNRNNTANKWGSGVTLTTGADTTGSAVSSTIASTTVGTGSIGFQETTSLVVTTLKSVKVLLNVEDGNDMPAYSDPSFDSVTNGTVIPMTAGTKLDLSGYVIDIDGAFNAIDGFEWSFGDAADTDIKAEDGVVYAYERGAYTATIIKEDVTAKIHFVVKNPGETEYVVYDKDYRKDGADVSDWTTTVVQNDTMIKSSSSSVNYVDQNTYYSAYNVAYSKAPNGFVSYLASDLMDNGKYAVYTTLNNEVVSAISDYTITAEFKAAIGATAVGVIGRATTTDGAYTVGTGAGFALASSAAHTEFSYTGGYFPAGAFSINGNTRTVLAQGKAYDYLYTSVANYAYVHRTLEIAYSGSTATLTTPNGGTEVLSDITNKAGAVGFVSYVRANNNKMYAQTPALTSFKVVLNNVDETKYTFEKIEGHTPADVPTTEIYEDKENYTFTVATNGLINGYASTDGTYSQKVVIPTKVGDTTSLYLSSAAFYSNDNTNTVAEIVFGDGFSATWDNALRANMILDTVVFPASFSSVGAGTFRQSGIVEAIFPEDSRLTTIGDQAFSMCYSLRKVVLPEGLKTIGNEAFSAAKSLTEVSLPSTVTSLGTNALAGCTLLQKVYVYNPDLDISTAGIPATATIYGYIGSTAHTYALENGNPFEVIGGLTVNSRINIHNAGDLTIETTGEGIEVIKGDSVTTVVAFKAGATLKISAGDIETKEFTVGEFDASNPNNFVNTDKITIASSGTEGIYNLTVNGNLKHNTFTVNGRLSPLNEADNTGKNFLLYTVEDDTNIQYSFADIDIYAEFEEDDNAYRTSVYGLGASAEKLTSEEGHKLKFVFRSPAITPVGSEANVAQLKETATVDGNEVTLTGVGVFMIPKVFLTDPEVMPTLTGDFNISDKSVSITNVDSRYKAANVEITSISSTTEDYADFRAVLKNIPDNMAGTHILSVPYITYTFNGETGVIYSDGISRSHDMISSLEPLTETEVVDIYREATDNRIEEIKSTSNTVDVSTVNGTVYYVSNSGNDNNDGKLQNTAIATIDKVNSLPLSSGDVVCFERGGVWRGSITAVAGVTYSSYGEGAKPQILGSPQDYADVTWEKMADTENVYKCMTTLERTTDDVGTIVFINDGVVVGHGIKKDSLDELTTDLDFYHGDDGFVYLYSTGDNPTYRWNDIEFSVDKVIFDIPKDANGVTVDNLVFRYAAFGIEFLGGSDLTVQNCEFYWIGGSAKDGGNTRYGNAIEVWGVAENINIDNCYFHQIYDAAVTFQYKVLDDETSKTAYALNFNVTNNVMEYCNYSVEYFINTTVEENSNYIDKFTISGNHMWYAGEGLAEQRPDKGYAAHIQSWSGHPNNLKTEDSIIIVDNIFALSSDKLCATKSDNLPAKYNNNTYIQYKDKLFGNNGTDTTVFKFDGEIRNTIRIKFFDANAKIVWVKAD